MYPEGLCPIFPTSKSLRKRIWVIPIPRQPFDDTNYAKLFCYLFIRMDGKIVAITFLQHIIFY